MNVSLLIKMVTTGALLIPFTNAKAQSGLTLVSPVHFVSNVSVSSSNSTVQRVLIDTIFIPVNHVVKFENAEASMKSAGPGFATWPTAGSGRPLFEIQLEGMPYGVLLTTHNSGYEQKSFPMWVGAGTHYLFVNVPVTATGYRYSLHGLLFRLN